MAMVVRGHGGDNGPPNDDRPWEPPAIHKNAKGRKKGSNDALIKKFEVGEKKKLPIKFDLNDLRTTKPIGPNHRHFTGLIGNEIKRSVPFCYESWDALPDKYKGTLWPAIHNKILKLRASQEGLAEKMTDDEIMDKVLGSSRAFKSGRGRKLPNSASPSSVCSYPAPPQSTSQAALRKFVEAYNEQMKDWHSQLADKNIELRLPAPFDPDDFMEDASDESDEGGEGDAHEDAAEPRRLGQVVLV
nr:hypothetical protein [Tanacetum cinerariifolium]